MIYCQINIIVFSSWLRGAVGNAQDFCFGGREIESGRLLFFFFFFFFSVSPVLISFLFPILYHGYFSEFRPANELRRRDGVIYTSPAETRAETTQSTACTAATGDHHAQTEEGMAKGMLPL